MPYSRLYAQNYALIDWSDLKPTPNVPRVVKDRPSFHVIPDIQPYRSILTGEYIGGRRQHRVHLRDHGMIEVGNERAAMNKPELPKLGPARDDVITVMKQKGLIG